MIDTAKHNRRMVRWMFWSVVVLMLASLGTFVLNLLTYLQGLPGD